VWRRSSRVRGLSKRAEATKAKDGERQHPRAMQQTVCEVESRTWALFRERDREEGAGCVCASSSSLPIVVVVSRQSSVGREPAPRESDLRCLPLSPPRASATAEGGRRPAEHASDPNRERRREQARRPFALSSSPNHH